MPNPPYRSTLEQLMQQAGIADLETLQKASGLSAWQLSRIQYGLLPKMSVETLVQLAKALNLPLAVVLNHLSREPLVPTLPDRQAEIERLTADYERLEMQLLEQRENVKEELQQEVLRILEPWLLQWPTAAAAAQKNPQWPAVKLLPLVRPLANLLKQWQVEAIAVVGETVLFDPQWHQLMESELPSEPGTPVIVRYVGYRQGKKLLYRAKVSPIAVTTVPTVEPVTTASSSSPTP